MRSLFLLCTFIPFSVFSTTPDHPIGKGAKVWTEGYALRTASGGLSANGVELGDYWTERDDGKCNLKYVRLADPAEFHADKIRTSAPPLSIKEFVGECPIKKFLIPAN